MVAFDTIQVLELLDMPEQMDRFTQAEEPTADHLELEGADALTIHGGKTR